MESMKTYVLGFSFSELGGWVLLIEKTKPEWQKGLLNGVGGKVEPFEKHIDAMVREFHKETGVQTKPEDWTEIGQLSGTGWAVTVYYTFGDAAFKAKTTTEEFVQSIPSCELDRYALVPNLHWIIPMCLDAKDNGPKRFDVRYA